VDNIPAGQARRRAAVDNTEPFWRGIMEQLEWIIDQLFWILDLSGIIDSHEKM
jgi:hypothetical protein